MKKIVLAAVVILLAVSSQAQPKFPSVDPRIKKAAEEKKRVDKILNATVSKITLIAYGTKQEIRAAFLETPVIVLDVFTVKGNGENEFNALAKKPPLSERGSTEVKWIFPVSSMISLKNATYKDFLNNGFKTEFNFLRPGTSPQLRYPILYANFMILFDFSDGRSVSILLQKVNPVAGTRANWALNANGDMVKRSIPGSAFPDPENPLKVPEVK